MRKSMHVMVFVSLSCLSASAGIREIRDDGVTYVSASPRQTLQNALTEVRGYQGHVAIGSSFASRAAVTIYDNTDITHVGQPGDACTTVVGFAPTICHEFGDTLWMTKKGIIESLEIAVYNSRNSIVDLCEVDVIVRLYDERLAQFATLDLGTVTLQDIGCLAPGYLAGVTFSGLDPVVGTSGCKMTITQQFANARSHGGAPGPTNAGSVVGMIPVVGDSDPGRFGYDGTCGAPVSVDWWFDYHDPNAPCARFFYRVDATDPAECPPPLYDSLSGSPRLGISAVAGSWIGDDLTYQSFGQPPPAPILNSGTLDIFKMTFWNWNADPETAASVLGADLEICFFDRTDPSTCTNTLGAALDYHDTPLQPSSYRTIVFTGLSAGPPFPIYGGLAGVKARATNVLWSTHGLTAGEIGQIRFDPVVAGQSAPDLYYFDPFPEFGGDDGWYSIALPSSNPANFGYYVEASPWPRGDLNCDGYVNLFDIDPFVFALTTATHSWPFDDYLYVYPWCDPRNADVNLDGYVDLFDVDPFVELLSAP